MKIDFNKVFELLRKSDEAKDIMIRHGILPIAKSSHTYVPPEHYKDGVIDDWRLPGEGLAYGTCGTYYTIGCLEHSPGYAKRIKYNCGRAECPVCSKSWLADTVNKAKDRLEAGKPRSYKKPIHVTISMPVTLATSLRYGIGYKNVRRLAIKLLKICGVHGGCLIFHPYRGSFKTKWRFSPHFHVLGYGWVQDISKLKRKYPSLTGWVIKNLGVRKSVGATLYYQLSHAGVRKGNHVVSWFGSLSWRRLKKIPERIPVETCPICGGTLQKIIYWGTGPNPFEGDLAERYDIDSLDWGYTK